MFWMLEQVWHAIKDVSALIIAGLVELINGIILAIAALAEALLALLPSFPDPPAAPGGVMGALLWIVPMGSILSFFGLMVTAWVGFLAIKVGLRWVKAL